MRTHSAIKFLSALMILGFVLSCSRITEKVEKKIDEKVNERIDEELKKVDSTLDRNKFDSLMKSMDTLKTKADSLLKGNKEKMGKKPK